MSARSLIEQGDVWRVGDRSQIQIWLDRWLGTWKQAKIISPMPDTCSTKLVSDLILPNSRQWNVPLLRCIPLPFEVSIVEGVPLPWRNTQDKFIWPYTKCYNYIVRDRATISYNNNI